MFKKIKNYIWLNARNVIGWRTKRKIVVLTVDDYGNVRVHSKQARERMDRAGLKILSRFDAYDALETREDLEMLFETLTSVKDKHNRPAVLTAFAVPCNINFEKMAEENYQQYHYELLPDTFSKLKGYEGTWELWQEGIQKGLVAPQFHGREHFNLKVFEEKLAKRDREVLTALRNRSYTSISSSGYPTISPMAAFEFWNFKENERFFGIIEDGLDNFEKVFGSRAVHFSPPGGREHPVIHQALKNYGIRYIIEPWIKQEHQGLGKYKRVIHYTGEKNSLDQIFMVRNVVFEPTGDNNIDWVAFTLRQVASAFQWNRPAVLSSHRVNFSGHIDPENRKKGIGDLKRLLKEIVKHWPEVEFMAANDLCDLIRKNKNTKDVI